MSPISCVNGIQLNETSRSVKPAAWREPSAFARMFACVSTTPLGSLVEPDENWMNAIPSPETRAGFARMLSRLDLDAAVERLDLPAIVVCGDRDRLTPIWHARRMAAALPQSLGLVTVPGAGHMTPVEAPRAAAEAVRRLVAEHPGEPADPARVVDVTITDEEIVR